MRVLWLCIFLLSGLNSQSQFSNVPDSLERKFYELTFFLIGKLDSGDFNSVQRDIDELNLLIPHFKFNWNYSNAVHKVNIASGRVALREGDVKAAKEFLLNAGKIVGSPQLKTFGPNMSLAKELLDRGLKKEVLEYLKLCSSFWEMGQEKLNQWIQVIEGDNIPDFGMNLKM